MKLREVLDVALSAGEILLCSGSEIYRVEDTLKSICESYNVDCESFVMPTGIFITGTERKGDRESLSLIKRIKRRTIDLHSIELVNSFARMLGRKALAYDEAMVELRKIENPPYFRFYRRFGAAGVTAFVYCVLFKGGILDALVAAAISMLIYSVREVIARLGFFQFFELFLSGMVAGGISVTASRCFSILNMDSIIVGAIMILVPGVAITNGIRDALNGDLVASLAKLCEALFVVIAVGAGVGIALTLGMNWM